MNEKGILSQLILDQQKFDNLLNLIDRELFFLSNIVDIDEYKSKLIGKQFQQKSTTQFLTQYGIPWRLIIPQNWLEMNPHLISEFENTVKLTTDFRTNKLIRSQMLGFNSWVAAECFFELFKSNSNWNYLDNGLAKYAQSVDLKYRVTYYFHEDEFTCNAHHNVLLIYIHN